MTEDPNERNSIAIVPANVCQHRGLHHAEPGGSDGRFLGRGSSARGYQLTMGIFLVTSVVMFLIAFAVSKEGIQPDPKQKTSVRAGSGRSAEERPWITLFLVTIFYFTRLMIRGNVMLPYFENCAGNQIALQLVQRLRIDRAADRRCLFDCADQAYRQAHAFRLEHGVDRACFVSRCSLSRQRRSYRSLLLRSCASLSSAARVRCCGP